MRQSLAAWMVAPVLRGLACWVQQPEASAEPDDFRLAFTNIVGLQYPQVNSARHVKFRIYSPDANGVGVFGAGSSRRRRNPNIWNLHKALRGAGIKSIYYESPRTAHKWLTWRRHPCESALLLLKD